MRPWGTRAASASGVYDGGVIQLHQNESARGPGPKTMEVLRSHVTKRVGRGYPADHVNELRAGIANYYNVAGRNRTTAVRVGNTPSVLLSVCTHSLTLLTCA